MSKRAPRAAVWHKAELPNAQPRHTPKRIVSLAPVVTETIFTLDRGALVVGVTRFCDRPAEAQKLAKVGGYVDISLEAVLALKPDLIVAMPTMGQRDVLDRARDHGVPVLVVFADTLAEVHGLARAIGAALGADAAAAALEKRLDDAALALARLPRTSTRAAVVVGQDPLVVAGPGTFADDVLVLAGLTPAVAADGPMWPVWSPESLVATRAELLIAAEGPEAKARLEALTVRALPAERRPRVVSSTRAILMRPGPALVDDLAELARLLSPAPAAPASAGAPR